MSNITQGLFKHIPCPNGDSCTAVRCLFGHSNDPLSSGSISQAPTTLQPSASGHLPTVSEGGGHRPRESGKATLRPQPFNRDSGYPAKRAKTEEMPSRNDYDPTSLPISRLSEAGQCQSVLHDTRAGTVSPPPLKRKREEAPGRQVAQAAIVQTGTATAGVSTAATDVTAPPTSNSSIAGAPTATTCTKASPSSLVARTKTQAPLPRRKAETLNPRYVSKAPAKHEIRIRLLKLLHSEYSRLNKLLIAAKDRPEDRKQYVLTEQGLIWAALDMEEHFATTKSATVYSDTIKHRIMGYKRMTIVQWIKERKEAKEAKEKARRERESAAAEASNQSSGVKKPEGSSSTEPSNLPGSTAALVAIATPPPKPIVTGLPPDQEFAMLVSSFLTPIDKLSNHGYVPKIPSPEDIQKARDAEEVSKGWEQCDRCSRRFQVFPGRREEDGALASGGKCQHHPGRLDRSTQVFTCCNEAPETSIGCETAANHVFKTKDPKRMAALWNFVETPANTNAHVDQAVCFDCEMAYTVHGMEVVRLTVTSWPGGERLIDVLVRPKGEIIDLNSRFSGIWPKDFANAVPFTGTSVKDLPRADKFDGEQLIAPSSTDRPPLPLMPSPEAARALFHSLIGPETVLIGHALENDLNTMRMVHPRLTDTVLLFPHPKGLPIRYSLRMLAKEHMGRAIQTGTLTGHDSAEDARAAGDLVRTKIKVKWDDMRLQGWSLVGGCMTRMK